MYTVAPPRAVKEAVAALLRPDADYSLHRLLDAMLALPQFGDPDLPGFKGTDSQQAVIGNLDLWTYAKARAVIDHAFGPEGHDHLKHAVATYRDQSLDRLDHDPVFFLRIGLLLRGGWTQDDGWLWWTTLATATHPEMPLDLAAGWVGAWGLDSLNACVRAGMGVDELRAVLDSGTLPDPAAITTLVALRPQVD